MVEQAQSLRQQAGWRLRPYSALRRATAVMLALQLTASLARATPLTDANVRQRAEALVRQHFGAGVAVECEFDALPDWGEWSGQEGELRARLTRTPSALGPAFVLLEFWRAGRRQAERTLTLRAHAFQAVVVAKERLDRHAALDGAPVAVERRELRAGAGRTFAAVEALAGKRTTRIVPAGDILTTTSVEAIPVVRRGEKVLLVAEMGGICVTATGVALADGDTGDAVAVKNDRSGKRLQGRVIATGTVRVDVAAGLGG